jgi:ubiquinone/menaquinone biosynthesis C-methylase UbiE
MAKFTYMDLLSELGIGGAHPGGLKATEMMLKNEPIQEDTVILDAGCGTGQTSAYLYNTYHANMIALDAHPVMIEKAKNRFLQLGFPVQVIEASLDVIPLEDQSVDYCLAESVLSFADIEPVLSEIKRVLKPGGVLYAIELTMQKTLTEVEQKQIELFYEFRQMWNEDRWKDAMEKAGFVEVEIRALPSFYEDQEPLTEFQPSEEVPDALFDLLEQNERLLLQYREAMGYRVIYAQK